VVTVRLRRLKADLKSTVTRAGRATTAAPRASSGGPPLLPYEAIAVAPAPVPGVIVGSTVVIAMPRSFASVAAQPVISRIVAFAPA
jgi:hypothetical protein